MEKKEPNTTKLVIITAIIAFVMTVGFIYVGLYFTRKAESQKTESTQPT
jgi:hypothetical protein